MKPHFTPSAAPSSGIFNPVTSTVGPVPAKVLGGTTTLQCRTRADIVAPGHFSSASTCKCATQAAMA